MTKKDKPQDISDSDIFPISKDKMFQLILDNIPTRIFWKNRDSVYLGSNRLFAEDAGVGSAPEILGKTDYDLAWKKSEADFFVETDQKVMDRGDSELGIIEPQKHADGKESWLETNKVPLKNDEGEVIGILGTYSDITERKQIFEDLKQKNRDLELKNKELEQFAFIASHDLQSPLHTIINYIDLFESENKKELSHEGQMYFNFIKEASVRMKQLITGLLEYSRIGHDIKLETVDSRIICENVLKDLQSLIQEKNATIQIDRLPSVKASPTELRILFQNLIENALKFSKSDVPCEIEITHSDKNRYMQFTISDNGIGIDPQFEDKIFVIYQQLHNSSIYGGNGIGLAYCKKILDTFGGKIWLDRNYKNGAKFHFTILK
ncbi:sensor histidine kinase [Reichenbachiella sp.]|uniref:sensor histidine kinase n=1 Tax=Reichenbachiella sp. TaxID=2184521 RepID=UPI003BB0F4F6